MNNLTQLRSFLLRASRLIREGDHVSAEQIIQNCLTSITAILERAENADNVLLDISIDVQNEILRQCKRANCDDYQTDLINENTTAIFSLNKQKYISRFQFEIVNKWLSVQEYMPQKGQKVLCVQDPTKTATREALYAIFDGVGFMVQNPTIFADLEVGKSRYSDIIKWMPLPDTV